MDGKKPQELLRGLMDTLNAEQREKAQRCGSAAALFTFLGEEGVALPDELLDEAAGGGGIDWFKCGSTDCNNYVLGGGLCQSCLDRLNRETAPSGGTVTPSGVSYWAQKDNFR